MNSKTIAEARAVAPISGDLKEISVQINAAHTEVERALRASVEHALRAGELLIEAKRSIGHGNWSHWLQENITFSDRLAQSYMRLARLPVKKRNAVAHLPLREALSAIRSRQKLLSGAEERENKQAGPALSVQVSTDPEKLTSGLPTSSDSSETPPKQATVTAGLNASQPPQSWTVVAIAEDGQRYGSGARFETKEEARAYMVHAHRPLWEYAINEIRLTSSRDNPNCSMDRFEKGRDKGKVRPVCRLVFEEGTCGNLMWGEIDANGNVVCGDLWDELNASEDPACDDGLDIPDYLQRGAP